MQVIKPQNSCAYMWEQNELYTFTFTTTLEIENWGCFQIKFHTASLPCSCFCHTICHKHCHATKPITCYCCTVMDYLVCGLSWKPFSSYLLFGSGREFDDLNMCYCYWCVPLKLLCMMLLLLLMPGLLKVLDFSITTLHNVAYLVCHWLNYVYLDFYQSLPLLPADEQPSTR